MASWVNHRVKHSSVEQQCSAAAKRGKIDLTVYLLGSEDERSCEDWRWPIAKRKHTHTVSRVKRRALLLLASAGKDPGRGCEGKGKRATRKKAEGAVAFVCGQGKWVTSG